MKDAETEEEIRARVDEACLRAGIGLDSPTRALFEELIRWSREHEPMSAAELEAASADVPKQRFHPYEKNPEHPPAEPDD